MTPSFLSSNVDDALDLFMDTAVTRGEDLYELDGETAFRRTGGIVETFDSELAPWGGQP